MPSLLYIHAEDFYCCLLLLTTISKESVYLLVDLCLAADTGHPIVTVGTVVPLVWEYDRLLTPQYISNRLRTQTNWSMEKLSYKLTALNPMQLRGPGL